MPILHVRALPQRDSSKIQSALKTTAAAIAEAYGCEAKQVWATWEEIKPGLYVEGEDHAESQPESTHPPIAQLLCFEGKSPDDIKKVLSTAAAALSESLGIKDNIFITYHEARSGQVIAGNGIVRKT